MPEVLAGTVLPRRGLTMTHAEALRVAVDVLTDKAGSLEFVGVQSGYVVRLREAAHVLREIADGEDAARAVAGLHDTSI